MRREVIRITISGTKRPYGDGVHEAIYTGDKRSWDNRLYCQIYQYDVFQRGATIQTETAKAEWEKTG